MVTKGVWVVFSYNVGPVIDRVFDKEIDAHRHQSKLGYGHVKFWEFGTDWSD